MLGLVDLMYFFKNDIVGVIFVKFFLKLIIKRYFFFLKICYSFEVFFIIIFLFVFLKILVIGIVFYGIVRSIGFIGNFFIFIMS